MWHMQPPAARLLLDLLSGPTFEEAVLGYPTWTYESVPAGASQGSSTERPCGLAFQVKSSALQILGSKMSYTPVALGVPFS
ncbi:unnamed protein product [Linum trigynum]|uniref:Uncharacterized protein n=1 Tax=Linum trigynum TaxID=586398 RepID=A0AAV2EXW4_9ROSI